MQKKICVIIPAKGPAEHLGACVDSVLACDYASKEIIVVDDGILAGAADQLGRYGERIRVLKNVSCGASAARNFAAGNTDAEFLAFTDSDCTVSVRWLTELMRGFSAFPDAAGGGGMQEIPQDASGFERLVFGFMRKTGFASDYVRQGRSGAIRPVEHNASCNALYKRSTFRAAGGFREGMWPGEDVELDYRLRKSDYLLFFNPGSVVYHHKPATMAAFRRMMFAYGRAQGELVCVHGFFRRIQFVPPLALLGIVSAVLYPIPALCLATFLVLAALLYLRSVHALGLLLVTLIFWNAGFMKGLIHAMHDSRRTIQR